MGLTTIKLVSKEEALGKTEGRQEEDALDRQREPDARSVHGRSEIR